MPEQTPPLAESEQCRYMAAAYPTLGAESCTEHRHDEPTFALARAFAAVCQSPEPTDEQIAWMLDDAGAIVDDFDPTPAEWTVTAPQATNEAGLDFTLTVNGVPYVIQQSEWEPSHPVALATWREWGHEDDEGDEPGCDHDWLDRPESDTHVCLACGEENSGPPPAVYSPGTTGNGRES